MAKYVDGFVLAIPTKNIDAYREIAEKAAKVWRKYGALDYKECIADDMNPEGIQFTFPEMINKKDNETIIFAYITYNSRAHRDEVNAKVMADPDMQGDCNDENMPFSMKRMAFGGFEVIVDGN